MKHTLSEIRQDAKTRAIRLLKILKNEQTKSYHSDPAISNTISRAQYSAAFEMMQTIFEPHAQAEINEEAKQ